MRMHGFEREVPEHDAHLFRKMTQQQLQCRRRLLASRAFEVRVLDHRHGGVLIAELMIDGGDRSGQTRVLRHVSSCRTFDSTAVSASGSLNLSARFGTDVLFRPRAHYRNRGALGDAISARSATNANSLSDARMV